MKANAIVRVDLAPENKLMSILEALEPETKNPIGLRSQASIEQEGNHLILKIRAQDSVALRATLNTYLRWMNAILNVFSTAEKREKSSG
jgi:tRNA threonylcarbamoyladenosine modification (KEOPS) complex  Pcc1 subunit